MISGLRWSCSLQTHRSLQYQSSVLCYLHRSTRCCSVAALVRVGGGEFLCSHIPSAHFVIVGERRRAKEGKGRNTVWIKG